MGISQPFLTWSSTKEVKIEIIGSSATTSFHVLISNPRSFHVQRAEIQSETPCMKEMHWKSSETQWIFMPLKERAAPSLDSITWVSAAIFWSHSSVEISTLAFSEVTRVIFGSIVVFNSANTASDNFKTAQARRVF